MSRADSKTKLQNSIAAVQKRIDWETNVNGDYSYTETTNPYDQTTAVSFTGIDGYKGWLTQWQSDNSGVSYDESFTFTDTAWDSKSDDERNQLFAHSYKERVTDAVVPNIDAFNTEKAALQADLDDLIAGEEAGDVDQVSG